MTLGALLLVGVRLGCSTGATLAEGPRELFTLGNIELAGGFAGEEPGCVVAVERPVGKLDGSVVIEGSKPPFTDGPDVLVGGVEGALLWN